MKQPLRIPADKHDVNAVQDLAQAPTEQVVALLAELLEWLRDLNWPVARPLIPVLARCQAQVVSAVRAALRSDDSVWKYWLLSELVPLLEASVKRELLPELRALSEHPNQRDVVEGVRESAAALLASLGGRI